MTSILINNNKLVDPFDLGAIRLSAEVLLKPLAKLCRYTGQVNRFYSVAEHTVHLINKVPANLRRAAALHDLNEGLTNDLPRPFKQRLTEYVEFEEAVQRQIFRWFNEPWANMEAIKEYDFRICADEMAQLFDEPRVPKGNPKPLGVTIQGWEWREAETRLRNAFNFLGLI